MNDFIFCPLSIYYHQLYGELSERMYYDKAQLEGLILEAIMEYKNEIFIYLQSYYRAFMRDKPAEDFPTFEMFEEGGE